MQRKMLDRKVVIVGEKGSGKTKLFNRFVYDEFDESYSRTIGAYFGMVPVPMDDPMKKLGRAGRDDVVNLGIWDLGGEEKFDSLCNFYCRNGSVFIHAVRCPRKKADEKTDKGMDDVDFSAININSRFFDKIFLEGEKDAVIQVAITQCEGIDPEQVKTLKEQLEKSFRSTYPEHDIGVTITSAKDGTGVKEAFATPVRKLVERYKADQAKKAAAALEVKETRAQLAIRDITVACNLLQNEIDNSCFPLNKRRKQHKVDFMNQFLSMYEKEFKQTKSLDDCWTAVLNWFGPSGGGEGLVDMQEVVAGFWTPRTVKVFQKYGLNFGDLQPQSASKSQQAPLLTRRSGSD